MSNIKVPSTNTVIIAGRLTFDPETKQTTAGQAICNLQLANTRYYRDRNTQESKNKVQFIRVVAWGYAAESAAKLRKGAAVIIEGALETDEWTDKDGQKRTQTRINASSVAGLEWADEAQGQARPQAQAPPRAEQQARYIQPPREAYHPQQAPGTEDGHLRHMTDDDIPF